MVPVIFAISNVFSGLEFALGVAGRGVLIRTTAKLLKIVGSTYPKTSTNDLALRRTSSLQASSGK
jgi:hypothetical protein